MWLTKSHFSSVSLFLCVLVFFSPHDRAPIQIKIDLGNGASVSLFFWNVASYRSDKTQNQNNNCVHHPRHYHHKLWWRFIDSAEEFVFLTSSLMAHKSVDLKRKKHYYHYYLKSTSHPLTATPTTFQIKCCWFAGLFFLKWVRQKKSEHQLLGKQAEFEFIQQNSHNDTK